jgi:RNA polymerase sigma-70 factor (ECF subfamily)
VTLFHRYQRMVYRFARQMSGRPDTAEDVTQDVFIALMQHGDRFDPRLGALGTYLYGMARNLVLRRLRQRGPRVEIDVASLGANPPRALVTETDPVDDLSRAERVAAMRRAILALPVHYREVVVLCELHGLSYEDAARIVACPIGTIRSRLSRAKQLLGETCRAREAAEILPPVPSTRVLV